MKNIKVVLLSLTLFTTTAFQIKANDLIELVKKNDIVNVKKLLETNKKIALNHTNDALYFACEKGYKNIVELLIQPGVNLNRQDYYNNTALHFASENGHTGIVELLIHAGANLHLQNYYGLTALHLAAENGHIEIVKLLIHAGVNLHLQDYYGLTALHLAARNNHTELVKLLIHAGANLNLQASHDQTPLMLLKKWPVEKLILLFKSLLPVSFEKENNESEEESNEKKFIEFGADELATQFKNETELSFPPNSVLPHNKKLVSGDQQERMAILLTIFQNYFEKDRPAFENKLKRDLVSIPVIPHITTNKKSFIKLIELLTSFELKNRKLTPKAFNQLKCWRSIAQAAWQKYNNTAKPQLWDISIKFKPPKSSVKFEEIPTH